MAAITLLLLVMHAAAEYEADFSLIAKQSGQPAQAGPVTIFDAIKSKLSVLLFCVCINKM